MATVDVSISRVNGSMKLGRCSVGNSDICSLSCVKACWAGEGHVNL